MLIESQIPDLPKSDGWKNVEIKETGEPLVLLNNLKPELIIVSAKYHEQKIPNAKPDMYLREGAANHLVDAAKLLPKGLKLVVWDAWRPIEVQQSLFEEFKTRLHDKNPDWDEEKLISETQRYVSLPSTNLDRPSPHNTGGAIDLSVCDESNTPIPMGVPFDWFGKEASTRYFEEVSVTGKDENQYRVNRRILYNTMTEAGFTNYDEEYWHFDFNNQFDAIRKKTVATYGAIMPVAL